MLFNRLALLKVMEAQVQVIPSFLYILTSIPCSHQKEQEGLDCGGFDTRSDVVLISNG
jgi:hypothetical protein